MTSADNRKAEPSDSQDASTKVTNDGNSETASGAPSTIASKQSKSQPIERFEDVIRGIYQARLKRETLRKKELEALRKSPQPTESERDDLLRLAMQDRILDRTRQLLLLGIQTSDNGVSHRFVNFAREVLAGHPLFDSKELQDVLSSLLYSLPSALDARTIQAVLSRDCGSMRWPTGDKPLTEKQCQQCRTNGAYCILLLFRMKRRVGLGRIHSLLQTNVWALLNGRAMRDEDKLRTLLCNRDPKAAAVVYGILEGERDEHRAQAEKATREKEEFKTELDSAKERLKLLEQELAEARRDNARIQGELVEEKRAHDTTISHWKDDHEQLKGQILRTLRNELMLLDEGLHALRREPPKVHVMIDHAERAIDGLKREMERLRRKDEE